MLLKSSPIHIWRENWVLIRVRFFGGCPWRPIDIWEIPDPNEAPIFVSYMDRWRLGEYFETKHSMFKFKDDWARDQISIGLQGQPLYLVSSYEGQHWDFSEKKILKFTFGIWFLNGFYLIFHLIFNWYFIWFTIGLQLVYIPIDLKLLLNRVFDVRLGDQLIFNALDSNNPFSNWCGVGVTSLTCQLFIQSLIQHYIAECGERSPNRKQCKGRWYVNNSFVNNDNCCG